ncbi:VOC family protein [Vibrio sp. S4M6]|uniref:VOC family protein n=1 Tax=Vibrio sinus TaxID=2946865 RepID=UPI002029F4D1|nr:VOC family protein [Vibrio sinus]MCL9783974.1 VOC family protein [Vibrio sinus]
MILGLDHINITMPIGSESDARKFYGEVLGLKEIPKPKATKSVGGVWFKLPDAELHIDGENVDRERTSAHFALRVEDIMLWVDKLSIAGIEIDITDTKENNLVRGHLRDPFGNGIELIER